MMEEVLFFLLSPFLIGWKKSLIDVNFIKLLTYLQGFEHLCIWGAEPEKTRYFRI